MKFLEFISAVNIFEAAKDRYTQMFTNLQPMFDALNALDPKRFQEERFNKALQEEMEWAMRVLKKQDRVIWYLRFVKIWLLRHLAQEADILDDSDEPRHDEFKPLMNNFKQAYNKAISQLAKKMGVSEDSLLGEMTVLRNGVDIFKRQMEHFLSLNLPALDAYVFSNQTPRQILADWMPIEDAWKARRKSTLPIDREGIDTVIKYPDGSEWVNLNKEYCTDEGEAMGHCGNSATPKEGDTVLSYRTIEEVDGEQLWKPRLTFILDKNGLLGETKGRANQKPDKKYHDVIVDLLRQDFVKGIKGGGHEAENNFKLADLPQDVTEKLHEEKPGLADIEYDYGKRGMTKELLQRMEGMWEDTQIAFPTYHKPTSSDGHFRNDTRYNMQEFLDAYGGHSGKYIGRVLNGDEHIDIAYDGAPIDDLFGELSPDIQHRVGEWIIDEHPELVEEWKEENDKDYDGTDARDTWSIIQEYEISEITDALERGYWRGDEVGAESAMYKSLESWLTELPNEHDFALELSPGWDGSDSRQELIIPEVEMINIMSNHLDEVTYASDLDEFAKIKELESPYNGWEGHDDDAAKEEAEQQLYEAGVLTG